MSLAQMSLTGSVCILFVLILRTFALNRLPKATFFILWEVAALRLLLPFSIPSPFHIDAHGGTLLGQVQQTVTELGLSPQSQPAGSVLADAPGFFSAAGLPILTMVWLAGTALMASYFALTYWRSIRQFKLSIPSNHEWMEAWLANHRTLRPLQVKVSDRILSPLTYGFFRPVILLPKNLKDGTPALLTYTLTHEYVHIRRFDMAAKVMFAGVLCVHWFNPLVWVMFILANRDMELSCDEKVIQMLGEKQKAAYALALLDLEEAKRQGPSLCSHFSSCAMEERTLSIMKYKKCSPMRTVLAGLLIVGATLCLAMPPSVSSPRPAAAAQTAAGAGKVTYTLTGLEDWLGTLQAQADALAERGELTQQQASDVLRFYRNQVAHLLSAAAAGHELMVDPAGDRSQPMSYDLDQLSYLPPTVDCAIASLLNGEACPDIAVLLPQGHRSLSFAGDF